MSPLRNNLSVRRTRLVATDPPSPQKRSSQEDGDQQRSSIDNFVIHGRSRFPSNQIKPPEPIPADYQIARNLLKLSGDDRRSGRDSATSQRTRTRLSRSSSDHLSSLIPQYDAARSNPFLGPFDTLPNSRNVSGMSYSGWSGTSLLSDMTTDRAAKGFVEAFNYLAERHDVAPLGCAADKGFLDEKPEDYSATSLRRQTPKAWFFGKLSRNQSSKNLRESLSRPNLLRKSSIGSLTGRRSKIQVSSQSLEDIYRFGGVSVLHLPAIHSATHLAIPTCLAATAQFLVENGRDSGGLFRIPGQSSATNAIYDHYMLHFREGMHSELGQVEATVGSNSLPADIDLSVHDVASAFKKFLRDIPGGILGSLSLFRSLKEVLDQQSSCVPKSRLMALAVLSIKSSQRFAMICAVFGLLAYLRHDPKHSKDSPPGSVYSNPDSMSAQALGVVFAPLLLGDLSELVEVELPSKSSPSRTNASPKKSLFHPRRSSPRALRLGSALEASKERANACALVVEYMVHTWEDVVRQMRFLDSGSEGLYGVTPETFTWREEVRDAKDRMSIISHLSNITENLDLSFSPMSTPPSTRTDHFKKLPLPPSPGLGMGNMLSRSASAVGLSASLLPPPLFSPVKHLSHSLTSLDLCQNSRWPSLQPARGSQSMREEDLAWWERQRRERKSPIVPKRRMGPVSETLTDRTPDASRRNSSAFAPTSLLKPKKSAASANGLTDLKDNSGVQSMAKHSPQNNTSSVLNGSSEQNPAHGSKISLEPRNAPSVILSHSSPTCPPHHMRDASIGSVRTNRSMGQLTALNANPAHGIIVPKRSPSRLPRLQSKSKERSASPFVRRGSEPSTESDGLGELPRPSLMSLRHSSGESAIFGSHNRSLHNRDQSQGQRSLPEHSSRTGSGRHSSTLSSGTSEGSGYGLRGTSLRASRRHIDPCLEPPVAYHLRYGSTDSGYGDSSRTPSNDHSDLSSGSQRLRVTMLYETITQLQNQLGVKSEENVRLKNQLDAMNRSKTTGTLAEQLRHAEREAKMWKLKSQWAESLIQGRFAQAPPILADADMEGLSTLEG